jgi:hypothetical protein
MIKELVFWFAVIVCSLSLLALLLGWLLPGSTKSREEVRELVRRKRELDALRIQFLIFKAECDQQLKSFEERLMQQHLAKRVAIEKSVVCAIIKNQNKTPVNGYIVVKFGGKYFKVRQLG